MNILPTALTAWRDERPIATAIKHHDRTGLALGVSVAFTFIMGLLGATKYGPLVTAIVADPNIAAAVGAVVAAVVAGFGHWASGGALANAAPSADAGPAGQSPAPAVAPASAGQVDTGPAHSDDPERDMPLGG